MIRVMSQDSPSAYCDCESCFLRYVSLYTDGRPTGFDEYYEESQYARRELLLPLRRLPWP